MIPKRMTFCWGNKSLPFLRYMTLYSFRKFHPDWEIRFVRFDAGPKRWETSERYADATTTGRDYINEVAWLDIQQRYVPNESVYSCVHFKDLYNWTTLASEGGFVADTDILFFGSIERHVNLSVDLALICYNGNPLPGYIPVTMMGGCANRFFADVFEKARSSYDPRVYQSCGTPAIGFNSLHAIRDAYPQLRIQQMLDGIINPFFPQYNWSTALVKLFKENSRHEFNPDCVAIHWFGNNNIISRDNMQCYQPSSSNDTTIGIVLSEVLDARVDI